MKDSQVYHPLSEEGLYWKRVLPLGEPEVWLCVKWWKVQLLCILIGIWLAATLAALRVLSRH